MRREFWEMLVDLLGALDTSEMDKTSLYITDVLLDLPVEIVMHRTDVGFQFSIDLPQWRQPTGFETAPGRLRLRVEKDDYEWLYR